MKIFGWMRNRQNGKGSHQDWNLHPVSHADHHSMQQPCKEEFSDWPDGLLAIGTFGNQNLTEKLSSCDDQKHIFPDTCLKESDKCNSPVDECMDSLHEDEKKTSDNSMVCSGAKDNRINQKRSGIGKRSLSYLLKKTLICSGNPIVKDPLLPDPNSAMEKILRTMLHKKIYPQRPSPKTASSHKYLDMAETESDEEDQHRSGSPESKWDKTDSEYIVLDI